MSHTPDLNLTMHRAPESVWDRNGWDGNRQQLALTRLLVGVGGLALAVQAGRRRSFAGTVLAGLGGSLAWWALTGEGDLTTARQRLSGLASRVFGEREDFIQQASAESFPASDAPAWTPTVGTGVRSGARR